MRMLGAFKLLLLVTLVQSTLLCGSASAFWQQDGTPACTAAYDQNSPQICSDGKGGAIITWQDYRSGAAHIYAQRVDASGEVQWAAGGVPICTAANSQSGPQITSDGDGGAIITWCDVRTSDWWDFDIYAQRVDASGNVLWTPNGVAVCTAAGTQCDPWIISDGAGGAIITWADNLNDINYDIYAQRVSYSGAIQWTPEGVVVGAEVCDPRASPESCYQIVSDGVGGAIVTWQDLRGRSILDIYAQRVGSSGNLLWASGGVAICTTVGNPELPRITSDGATGAIITWDDYRSGSNPDIYAQRVGTWGNVMWTTDGVPICAAASNQRDPRIIPDGSGGAIIAWSDYRSGTSDIYGQRVDAGGNVTWAIDGKPICTASGYQGNARITSDGSGRAIITWNDLRSGNDDIYAQRITDFDGNVMWAAGGVPVCEAANNQFDAQIASEGAQGAIITWDDWRDGSNSDIYAQRVDVHGNVGPNAMLVLAYSTSNTTVDAVFDTRLDPVTSQNINNYYLGTGTAIFSAVLDPIDSMSVALTTGTQAPGTCETLTACCIKDAGGTVMPEAQGYSFRAGVCPISFIQTPKSFENDSSQYATEEVTVAGIVTGDRGDFTTQCYIGNSPGGPWSGIEIYGGLPRTVAEGDSVIVAGYVNECYNLTEITSVDYLRVVSSANRIPGPDLVDPGEINTGSSTGESYEGVFVRCSPVIVADTTGWGTYREWRVFDLTPDTVLVGHAGSYGYVPSVGQHIDIRGPVDYVHNDYRIEPRKDADISVVEGVDPGSQPKAQVFALEQNSPNPFNPVTTIFFSFPEKAEVKLYVCDVSGRVVRILVDRVPMEPGRHKATWDGRDNSGRAVSSGIYFCKLSAVDKVAQVKMVILK